jgi:predicted DNA-binding protein (MmcQ/YjbR family)
LDAHGSDDNDLARIRTICLRFPEAEEAGLQGRSLFRVRTRRFALFNGNDAPARKRWSAVGRSLHFVTDPQDREALAQDPRFRTSPHHGDRGWMALDLERDDVDWDEVGELLETAYRQVARRQLIEELDREPDPDLG